MAGSGLGVTTVVDLIRGKPTFDNALLEDFVIARADGSALFMLANAWTTSPWTSPRDPGRGTFANTPKQQLLWEALGQQPPDLGDRRFW